MDALIGFLLVGFYVKSLIHDPIADWLERRR